jgi:hypothetical protein
MAIDQPLKGRVTSISFDGLELELGGFTENFNEQPFKVAETSPTSMVRDIAEGLVENGCAFPGREREDDSTTGPA